MAQSDADITYRIQGPFVDENGDTLSVNVEGAYQISNDVWVTTDLDSVTMNTPHDYSGNVNFNVAVIATNEAGLSSSQTVSMALDFDAQTDGSLLYAAPTNTDEDALVALNLSLHSLDNDDSESIIGLIDMQVTAGSLSGTGVVDNGNGSYSVSANNLPNVTFTPPENTHGNFSIETRYTTQDTNATPLAQSKTITVAIASQADSASVEVSDAHGSEGDATTALTLNFNLEDSDGSESGYLEISGLPSELSLTGGSEYDGVWRVPQNSIDNLAIIAPEHFSGDFALQITPIAYDIASSETATGLTQTVGVTIDALASAIELTPIDTSATEGDSAIALDLQLNMSDNDGSEKVLLSFDNFPEGTTFSEGTLIGGTWVVPALTLAEAENITITPPEHFSGDLDLAITARTIDANNTLATPVHSQVSIAVEAVVSGVAHLTAQDEMTEVTGVNLVDIGFSTQIFIDTALVDASEHLSLRLDGLGSVANIDMGNLSGANLTQEGNSYLLENLSDANLTTLQEEGLTLTTQAEGSIDTINITATATESNGESTSMTQQVQLDMKVGLEGSGDDDTLHGLQTGLDGGDGVDTLVLLPEEDITFDTLKDGVVNNIETINLHENGTHNVALSVEDVLDMTDENNTLKIEGDADDSVEVDTSEWFKESTENGTTTYTDSESDPTVTLQIDTNIDISEI